MHVNACNLMLVTFKKDDVKVRKLPPHVQLCHGSCLNLFMRMLSERLVLECFSIEFRTGMDD